MRPRCVAATTPVTIPVGTAITTADTVSSTVGTTWRDSSETTGTGVLTDDPRSNCSRAVSHWTYWTGTGWSRLCCSRNVASISGVASTPRMAVAGSPGARWIRKKLTSEIPNSVGTRRRTRLPMYDSIAGQLPRTRTAAGRPTVIRPA
jgi:hypothetical protein